MNIEPTTIVSALVAFPPINLAGQAAIKFIKNFIKNVRELESIAVEAASDEGQLMYLPIVEDTMSRLSPGSQAYKSMERGKNSLERLRSRAFEAASYGTANWMERNRQANEILESQEEINKFVRSVDVINLNQSLRMNELQVTGINQLRESQSQGFEQLREAQTQGINRLFELWESRFKQLLQLHNSQFQAFQQLLDQQQYYLQSSENSDRLITNGEQNVATSVSIVKKSLPGQFHFFRKIKVYQHVVPVATSSKLQTQFPIAGQVQSFPYSPGYSCVINEKLTETDNFFSREVGRSIGFVTSPAKGLAYVTFTIRLKEGTLAVSGLASAQFPFEYTVSGGTGEFLGTFGNIEVYIISSVDSGMNHVLLYDITLYCA